MLDKVKDIFKTILELEPTEGAATRYELISIVRELTEDIRVWESVRAVYPDAQVSKACDGLWEVWATVVDGDFTQEIIGHAEYEKDAWVKAESLLPRPQEVKG